MRGARELPVRRLHRIGADGQDTAPAPRAHVRNHRLHRPAEGHDILLLAAAKVSSSTSRKAPLGPESTLKINMSGGPHASVAACTAVAMPSLVVQSAETPTTSPPAARTSAPEIGTA